MILFVCTENHIILILSLTISGHCHRCFVRCVRYHQSVLLFFLSCTKFIISGWSVTVSIALSSVSVLVTVATFLHAIDADIHNLFCRFSSAAGVGAVVGVATGVRAPKNLRCYHGRTGRWTVLQRLYCPGHPKHEMNIVFHVFGQSCKLNCIAAR